MKSKWKKREKLLFLTPLLLLAPYLYMMVVGRHTLRHPEYLLSVAFAPDGRTLVTGCGDNFTRLWNVENGRLEETFDGDLENVASVAVSPNGSLVARGTIQEQPTGPRSMGLVGDLRVWKRGASTPLYKVGRSISSNGAGTTLSFSPDGRTLASGGTGIELRDANTGRLLRRLGGVDDDLWSIAFSPDGQTLVTGDYEGRVKLWNLNTGKARQALVYSATKKWVRAVAFSPDGSLVAGGGDDGSLGNPTRAWTVKLWDAHTGILVRSIDAHGNNIRALKFSPTGNMLASGGYDNTVKLWDVQSGALLRTLPHKDGVSSLDFSPDGKTLASGCDDGKVRLWELE